MIEILIVATVTIILQYINVQNYHVVYLNSHKLICQDFSIKL